MKSFLKFISTIILTLVFSIIILSIASKIFTPKWIDHKMNMMTFIMKGFYNEDKNSLDVIFMGNSDSYRGIDPLAMYHEYGFTSYAYVSAGQRVWTGYALFEEAIKYQKPKLILFNTDALFQTNQSMTGNYSKSYDNLRFSINKIKAVFDKNYDVETSERVAKLLPILGYHSRYTELTKDDLKYAFYNERYALKGMDMVAYRVPYKGDKNYMKDNKRVIELPKSNIEYIDKMYDKCKELGIEFALYHVPSPESSSYEKYAAVDAYAKEKGIKHYELNLDIDSIGIDWSTDTSDGGDHLNMFGAEKTSIYLGKLLKEDFNLPDHRGEDKYKSWDEDYNTYLDLRKQEIIDAKNLGKY